MTQKKAVFFDRDGVINIDSNYYTYKTEDFVVNETVFESLKLLQKNDFLLFIITNQSGVAKNIYTNDDVEFVHAYFNKLCIDKSIVITEIFHCPHHPDYSRCICRKPDSLLIEKALAQFNVSASKSFFIGDRARDIEAADKVGLSSFLIESNSNLLPVIQKIITS